MACHQRRDWLWQVYTVAAVPGRQAGCTWSGKCHHTADRLACALKNNWCLVLALNISCSFPRPFSLFSQFCQQAARSCCMPTKGISASDHSHRLILTPHCHIYSLGVTTHKLQAVPTHRLQDLMSEKPLDCVSRCRRRHHDHCHAGDLHTASGCGCSTAGCKSGNRVCSW